MSKPTKRRATGARQKSAAQSARQTTKDSKPVNAKPSDEPADLVDEASDESFPASDPPAWTETTASKNSAKR